MHTFIPMFLYFCFIGPKNMTTKGLEKEFTTNCVCSKPREVKFYTGDVRVSVTNSMSALRDLIKDAIGGILYKPGQQCLDEGQPSFNTIWSNFLEHSFFFLIAKLNFLFDSISKNFKQPYLCNRRSELTFSKT